MKNLLKMSLLCLTLSMTFIACDPPKTTKNPGDTVKVDSPKSIQIDTAKKDTLKK